jgi:transcriptional regulator with XRE-family HTH domain
MPPVGGVMRDPLSKQPFTSFSQMLKSWRTTAGLTQRQVAQDIGVKPSYVAYLEAGQRQPSLNLAIRLAELMKVDPVKLCCAAQPELAVLLADEPKPSGKHADAWKRFLTEASLLKRFHVTDEELRVLKEVSRLGKVARPRDLLFVLNTIRQSLEDD